MKKKLVFISNMASPYQIKFCYALQEYFDAEFWFYVRREENRPKWWEIPMGEKCKVFEKSGYVPVVGYYSLGMLKELKRFDPDILLMGGFMNWNWLISRWAKKRGKKIVLMGESLRYAKSDGDASDELMTRGNSPIKLGILSKMFRGWDLYAGMGDVAKGQFEKELRFPGEKVVTLEYPIDIDEYFNHPYREKKAEDKITLLFASRLIGRYQPLFALEVYRRISEKYPNIYMKLNNDGPLKADCEKYIEEYGLINVSFLDDIDSWNNMNKVYRDADILILPATYSNGNISISEAGASGMGIVISDKINNMESEMIDGQNCFITGLSIDSFVDRVSRYIEDPSLFLEHGKKSRQLIDCKRNHHTAKLYYRVLSENGILD